MAVWPLLALLLIGILAALIGIALVRAGWFRHALVSSILVLLCLLVAGVVILRFSYSRWTPPIPPQSYGLREVPAQPIDSVHSHAVHGSLDEKISEATTAVAFAPAPSLTPTKSAPQPRPTWLEAPEVHDGGPPRRVVSSQRFATVDEAWQDALTQASQVVKDHLFRDDPIRSAWTVPKDWIRAFAVQEFYEETVQQDLGPVSASMHRVHLLLELSGATGERLAQLKKDAVVTERLWMLGGGTGLLTLLFGTIAGYLRLDAATHGAYRGRLKLAAASVLGAAGVSVLFLA